MWQVVLLMVYVLLRPVCAPAQIYTSARLLGMGAVSTTGRGYAGDLLGNPAGITANDRPALLVGHQYMYYQPEVSSQIGLVVLPFRQAPMGLAFVHFGLESAYSFTSLGYFFGKRFGPDLSIAWAMHYRHFRIPAYREERGADLDIGFQYTFSPEWIFGGVARNIPIIPFPDSFQHALSPEARIGATYRPGGGLDLALDLVYRKSGGTNLYTGLEYAFVPEVFFLRLGLTTVHTLSPFAGLGLGWKKFRLDAGSSIHATLGMSPQIDLSYVFED